MTRRMARRPLVVLPSGHLIFAEDIKRLQLGRKARLLAELVVLLAMVALIAFGATAVDPVRP